MLTLRLPCPALVALSGASGAGKSTLARRLARQLGVDHDPGVLVSYDACREEISGDMSDQSATAAAVMLAHRRIAERCAAGRASVVDATHTLPAHRRRLVDMADHYHLPAVLIVVATSEQECVARQRSRPPRAPGAAWGRRVPADVVRAQHAAVTQSLPTLHTEGWHAVHVLNLRPQVPEPATERSA